MTLAIRGSRVLLTGASGGIGHEIARRLRREGADLVLSGRNESALRELADETGADVVVADLAKPEAIGQLQEAVGEVDVIVANAALPGVGYLDKLGSDEIDRIIDVNLRSPIQLTHAYLDTMLQRGRGHFAFIGSVSGILAAPGSSMYSATKFGLRGFVSGLRQDLHGTGVGVSLVMPAFVSEAGMFVDSGMDMPPGTRTVTPAQVSNALVKSILKDVGETVVAPIELRVGAKLGQASPRASAAIMRMTGAADIVASHQGKN